MAMAAPWSGAANPFGPAAEAGEAETPSTGDLEALRQTFLHPPDSARPMTRWWWFGGAVTPQEITRELTHMRDAGLRGAEIQPVYPLEVDDPERGIHNIPYFSREWFEVLAHTVREARRLGMQLDFTLGSGWPYGGPFIPVDLAARKLRVLSQDTVGPGEFTWDFGPQILDDERIVTALAMPVLESEEPDISRSRVMDDRSKEAAANPSGEGLTGHRIERWKVPAGEWRIMIFIDGPTGMQVKRPTVGMEGYVLDHFRRQALQLFLRAAGDRTLEALREVANPPFHSIFCDSLEVYGADWTASLLEEFRRRRGYDLTPYLPCLAQEAGSLTPHVRHDYHLTLSELILEDFFRPLAEWAERNGMQARIQAHGAFGDVMQGYGLAGIPEGESIFGGDTCRVNLRHRRLASSAAHVYGKPLVSAETYTWLRTPRFMVTLEMMKAASDASFLDGINHIVNHGYPYSPPQAGEPGWVFYASTLVNHNNIWWRHYHHLARYVQRVSGMLCQGVAVNPVGVYLPLADVFAKQGSGALSIDGELEEHLGTEFFDALRRAGYDFDLLNDDALSRVAKVEGGKLRAGTGVYSAVVLPAVRFMPPESLERIAEFAESGGQVIFIEGLPEEAPGLAQREERTARLRAALKRLSGDGELTQGKPAPAGSGQVSLASSHAEALKQLGQRLWPDCSIIEAGDNSAAALEFARANVGFLHRRLGPADFYFLSNLSSQTQNLRVRFAAGHRRPERWNPETGACDESLLYAYAAVRGQAEKVTGVQLRLDPFESCFVVFGESQEEPLVSRSDFWGPVRVEKIGKRNVASGLAEVNARHWLETPGGERHRFAVSGVPEPIRLSGPWTVRLGEGSPIAMRELKSWNELPQGKTYSGWATYETTFEVTGLGEDLEWMIDLGRVHETAEVELNGVELGAAWKGLRRLSCGDAIKPGKNHLTVRVANLWIHHMQSLPKPDVRAVAETYGIRWGRYGEVEPQSLPPSGLIGPVQLLASKRWRARL
jgi:hypothetical protein